jgi:hypothetical protein
VYYSADNMWKSEDNASIEQAEDDVVKQGGDKKWHGSLLREVLPTTPPHTRYNPGGDFPPDRGPAFSLVELVVNDVERISILARLLGAATAAECMVPKEESAAEHIQLQAWLKAYQAELGQSWWRH